MFIITIAYPVYLFPFAWIFLLLIMDGYNYRHGYSSFMENWERGLAESYCQPCFRDHLAACSGNMELLVNNPNGSITFLSLRTPNPLRFLCRGYLGLSSFFPQGLSPSSIFSTDQGYASYLLAQHRSPGFFALFIRDDRQKYGLFLYNTDWPDVFHGRGEVML